MNPRHEAMAMNDKIAVMKGATMDQFDTPRSIFHDPVSEHVATIIVTPLRDILDSTVENGRAQREALSIPLPKSSQNGNNVRFGIRPLYSSVGGGDIKVDVIIDDIEPRSIDYIIHTSTVEGDLRVDIVTEDVSDLETGDTITIGASLDHIHLFKANGERIQSKLSDHQEALK